MATLTASVTEKIRPDRQADSDRQLVACFVDERDEGAFGEIVRRYGPLVLGVCRRVLGEVHEAEDAFQATFLVLARDARKIRRRTSLACWLHGVAYRISLRAARRRSHQMEQLLDDLAAGGPSVLEIIARRHDQRMIDEELSKLPITDRESLTLRYLEDRSNSDIAAALEISVAAVEGRLKRARRRLRRQLLRRGVSLGLFLSVVAASRVEVQAVESLLPTTVELALVNADGGIVEGSYSCELAGTEMGEMALSMKTVLTVAATTVLAVGLGLYGLSGRVVGQESQPEATITVDAAADSFGDRSVRVVATPETTGEVKSPAAPSVTSGTTSPRLRSFEKISRALDQGTMLEFNEAPLSEFVDYLKTANSIPVIIDHKGLDDIGLGSDTPITVSVSDISLRSCLALIFDELGLDYVITNEMLVITSKEAARQQLDPRIYKTDDLQIPEEKLIEIITSMVAPDTWEETGGTGKITSLGDLQGLVIAQTDQIHDQIADLLEKLQHASRE